jgi:hypothetical protein
MRWIHSLRGAECELQQVSFVKSVMMTDTNVSIERVHLALYDSYVVTGPFSGGLMGFRR